MANVAACTSAGHGGCRATHLQADERESIMYVKDRRLRHTRVADEIQKDTHYVGLYACMPHNDAPGYGSTLLELSPLENENVFAADDHYNFDSFVISVFWNSFWNVLSMTGQICSTNFGICKESAMRLSWLR